MDKKMYITPEVEVVDINTSAPLLAGSDLLDPDAPKTDIGEVGEDEIG